MNVEIVMRDHAANIKVRVTARESAVAGGAGQAALEKTGRLGDHDVVGVLYKGYWIA